MRSELDRLCEEHGIKIDCTFVGEAVWPEFGDKYGSRKWKVTLRTRAAQLTTTFYQGLAHEKDPSAADVLGCLLSDASCVDGRSFEEFCGDLGYDVDSRKAERIYNACRRTAPKVRRLLGAHFETFAQAEH